MTITQTARPFVLCEAEVVLAQRLSPSFVRVHLAAPELAEFGTVGPYAVIAALRSENQWTQWGGEGGREALKHWSRDKLLATFNLKKPKWEEKLIIRGRKLFADALADLQGEQTR